MTGTWGNTIEIKWYDTISFCEGKLKDCAGECGGDGPDEGKNCDGSCAVVDCNGECGGSSTLRKRNTKPRLK